MKNADFTRFFQLMEEREPVFRQSLAEANNMIKQGFLDHSSCAETILSYPQNPTQSPPSNLDIRGGASPVGPGYISRSQAGDACSGADLDALLSYSFRRAAEDSWRYERCTDLFKATKRMTPYAILCCLIRTAITRTSRISSVLMAKPFKYESFSHHRSRSER